MYCKYCGQKIDDDSTFCSGCGAKISIAVQKAELDESADIQPKAVGIKQNIVDTVPAEEEFDPTFHNIMGQFSPVGRIVFAALCILMVIWVATLTVHIFYPEVIDILSNI